MAEERAVRLKVTLDDCVPPVWRRLLVAETATLGDLHGAVQAAMGWEESHLHLFEVGRREQYGVPRDLDVDDERQVTVGALARPVKKFTYVYDMGDDWRHTIAIEGFEPLDPARAYPACTDGAGACPPEDSGGPFGFADMLEAVADPGHPRHGDYSKWLGEFDPAAFSVAEAEARLRRWFRPKRGRKRKTPEA